MAQNENKNSEEEESVYINDLQKQIPHNLWDDTKAKLLLQLYENNINKVLKYYYYGEHCWNLLIHGNCRNFNKGCKFKHLLKLGDIIFTDPKKAKALIELCLYLLKTLKSDKARRMYRSKLFAFKAFMFWKDGYFDGSLELLQSALLNDKNKFVLDNYTNFSENYWNYSIKNKLYFHGIKSFENIQNSTCLSFPTKEVKNYNNRFKYIECLVFTENRMLFHHVCIKEINQLLLDIENMDEYINVNKKSKLINTLENWKQRELDYSQKYMNNDWYQYHYDRFNGYDDYNEFGEDIIDHSWKIRGMTIELSLYLGHSNNNFM